MPVQPKPRPRAGNATGSIERLQVYWVASSLLLLLVIVLVTLFGAGALQRMSKALTDQSHAIEAADARIADLESSLERMTGEFDDWSEPSSPPARVVPPKEPPRHEPPKSQEHTEAPPPPPPVLMDAEVCARLEGALATGSAVERPRVLDREQATDLLDEVVEAADRVELDGETWADLALLALAMDRGEDAERFAFRAADAGVAPVRFYELSVRGLLDAGSIAEALVLAQQLTRSVGAGPAARVLLASAQFALGRLGDADATLSPMPSVAELSSADRLRLAEVLAALERWNDLRGAISGLSGLSPEQRALVNEYRAVLEIQDSQYATALAILDNLLESRPEDYEIRTWRGVALLKAGQYEAARQALAHAERNAGRPEAWYWRGILEMESGHPRDAIDPLQTALAADARFAPAHEALATLAMNDGDVDNAIDQLNEAIQANPRRASSQFLLALAQAKASRRDEAEAALRKAFALDPSLLAVARETEVITALFAPSELDEMATGDEPKHAE